MTGAAVMRPAGVSTPTAARGDRRLREGVAAVVLAGPAVLLIVVFVVVPLMAVVMLAASDWSPLRGGGKFVGFDNVLRVSADGELEQAIFNTVGYAVLTVPLTVGISLAVAVGIRSVKRGATLWQAAYFLPAASTLTAMAVVWSFLFYPGSGAVDSTIGRIIGVQDWLESTTFALPAIAVVGNWQGIGASMVMLLAGLSTLPRDVDEAAQIDGAGRWHRFVHVTLPAVGPALLFTVVIATRNALQVFDQVRVMTDGGPLNSTETLSFYIWQHGIPYLDVGGASVASVALMILLLAVIAVQYVTVGRRMNRGGAR